MKTRATLKQINIPYGQKQAVISLEVAARPEDLEEYLDADLDISLDKHRKLRSKDANACMWECLGQIAKILICDPWDVYLAMLGRYGKYTHIYVEPNAVEAVQRQWRETRIVGSNGDMVEMICYYGSSLYDSKEFSVLLDGIISEMKEIGLTPPAPQNVREMITDMERKEHDKSSRPSQAW